MIRVVRILEYTYADAETMAEDQKHWELGLNGVRRPNSKVTIRSATLPIDFLPDEPEERPAKTKAVTEPQAKPDPSKTLTGGEVMAMLGINDRKLRRLRSERKIAYYRLGNLCYYNRDDVEDLLRSSRVPSDREVSQ